MRALSLKLFQGLREALFFDGKLLFLPSSTRSPELEKTDHQYSYLVFGCFALVYFSYYLPQGFSIYDDAYLLALGKRIADGQHIYSDFYYLRTPLSPLIQSFWIGVFGDGYTVLLSRVIWALQLFSTIVFCSLIYRRWLSAVSLAFVLCATLVYSSLLFAFPWYTYDGIFFASLFALFAFRRRMFLAGVFAGLAFLCKQGFVVIVPLYLLSHFLEEMFVYRKTRDSLFASARFLTGFVAIVVLALLALEATMQGIWNNIYTLPSRITDLPFTFLIYQDLPDTFMNVWPLASALFLIVVIPFKSWIKVVALALWLVAAWSIVDDSTSQLPQVITLVSFASLSWFYGASIIGRHGKEPNINVIHRTKLCGMALIILYASGFNYNGWVFSYIGAVISLPILILFTASWGDLKSDIGSLRMTLKDRFGGWLIPTMASVMLVLALTVHHQFPYKSPHRSDLTVPFSSAKLVGIYSDSVTVAEIDGLALSVLKHSASEAKVLAFPEPASLSFLISRQPWGKIQWYYKLEFDSALASESVEFFESSPPDLVVLKDPDLIPETPQFDMLYHAIYDNFKTVDTVGPFHILVPQCREDSGKFDTSI
ncbi:hypothetical protein JYU19_00935 [bacterium AH-315-J21]|nr:hypothetical protein [bacterium AH-315-J21]